MSYRPRLLLWLCLLISACQGESAVTTSQAPFKTEVLASHLDQPWGLAFLPDGALLITQKSGQLILLDGADRSAVKGVPESLQVGQGGLLDIALHPKFSAGKNWVYLSYSIADDNRYATAMGRGRLLRHPGEQAELTDWQELFRLPISTRKGHHFGSRLAFDTHGDLFMSVGDRGQRERAQDLSDPAGAILRFQADGQIHQDNPFIGEPGKHPAIYSYGHRNPQGLALNPGTAEIWAHEHGPQGGDEVNRIESGQNYGWPVITYGKEYGSGFAIGEGTHKAGMQQPLHTWVPSIAPSGMAFYRGDAFTDWQGDLLIGALKAGRLVRLQIKDGQIQQEFRYLAGEAARIRDVRVGPDGLIYLLTDARDGQLIRLTPLKPN